MQLEFKNSINFLCLKEGIKQFGHLCNWELSSVSSLEVKIIKEPLRRQLLETKLKGAVPRNSAKLGNYKMPVKLRET